LAQQARQSQSLINASFRGLRPDQMTINFFDLVGKFQANIRATGTAILAGQYHQLLAI
jgi:hypothetical protein